MKFILNNTMNRDRRSQSPSRQINHGYNQLNVDELLSNTINQSINRQISNSLLPVPKYLLLFSFRYTIIYVEYD